MDATEAAAVGAKGGFDANDFSRFDDIGKGDGEAPAMSDDSDDELPLTEQIRRAEACKAEGNDLFRAGANEDAQAKYEQGLAFLKPTLDNALKAGTDCSALVGPKLAAKTVAVSLHLNMAAVLNKRKLWHPSIRHATRALDMEPMNSKALYRRGVASTRSGDLDGGRNDLEATLVVDPENAGVKRELKYNMTATQRARKKDKASFKGLFAESLYNDKELERQRKLEQAAKKEAELRAEYDAEKAVFENQQEKGAKEGATGPPDAMEVDPTVDNVAAEEAAICADASVGPAPDEAVERMAIADSEEKVAADPADEPAVATDVEKTDQAMEVDAGPAVSAEEPDVTPADDEASSSLPLDAHSAPAEDADDPAGDLDADPLVPPAATFPTFETWKEDRKKAAEAEAKKKKDAEEKRKREEQAKRDEEKRRRREEKERERKEKGEVEAASGQDATTGDSEASELRGYRRTADGKVTTYFNREMSEEAKKLLGDTTPQRLESGGSAASGPTPAAAPSATGGAGSAWNAGGTWEERDLSMWAKAALERHVGGVTAEKKDALNDANPDALVNALRSFGPGSAGAGGDLTQMLSLMQSVRMRVTKVKKVDGDASITVVRGTPRYIYEMNVEAEFEAVVTEQKPEAALGGPAPATDAKKPKTYKGKMTLTDLNSIDREDCTYQATWKSAKGPTTEHTAAVSEALGIFKEQIFAAVEAFSAEFRQK